MKDSLESLLILIPLATISVIVAAHYIWGAWKELKEDEKDDDRS